MIWRTEQKELLKQGGVNAAFITVGRVGEKSMKVINGYVAAVQEANVNSPGAYQALHVEASDSAQISKAFEQIAELMDSGGLTEDL